MSTLERRPAHRPSRRGDVIDAAMRLLASRPSEDVTVTEIADACGMTPAAIYYHFAGKDDILLEGLRAFGTAMVEELQAQVDTAIEHPAQPGAVLAEILEWIDHHRAPARFYFVNSAGLSETIEALRRAIRIEVLETLAILARSANPSMNKAEAGVTATGMLAALENAAVSWLSQDEIWLSLGRKQFLAEFTAIIDRLVGVGTVAK